MQKTARKNSLYWKNEIILKIAKSGHQAKVIAFAKSSLGSKVKIAKKHAINVFPTHCSCFMQKTAPKTATIRKMRAF